MAENFAAMAGRAGLLERVLFSVDAEATARAILAELQRNGLKQTCIWVTAVQPVAVEPEPERYFANAAEFALALAAEFEPEQQSPALASALAALRDALERELGAGRFLLAIQVGRENRDAVERLVAMLSADVRGIALPAAAEPEAESGPAEGQLAPA
jgi:hypothetical protein